MSFDTIAFLLVLCTVAALAALFYVCYNNYTYTTEQYEEDMTYRYLQHCLKHNLPVRVSVTPCAPEDSSCVITML